MTLGEVSLVSFRQVCRLAVQSNTVDPPRSTRLRALIRIRWRVVYLLLVVEAAKRSKWGKLESPIFVTPT